MNIEIKNYFLSIVSSLLKVIDLQLTLECYRNLSTLHQLLLPKVSFKETFYSVYSNEMIYSI